MVQASIYLFEYPQAQEMADTYDVDDTGGWDATHEAAAAAAAAHAAGELGFQVLVIFLDTCVLAGNYVSMTRRAINTMRCSVHGVIGFEFCPPRMER